MAKTGETWNFTYNTDGLRTSRSNGTTTYNYVYNNGQLRKMTVNGQPLIFRYGADGKPYSLRYAGVDYLYILNAQGDVIGIANTSGTQVVSYAYDPWGNILSVTDSTTSGLGQLNPLRYRGYVYDNETGLYYVQTRYYNPEIGRWINADDPAYLGADGTHLSYNLFAYCQNNPVQYSDTTGTFINTITGALVGAIVGAINAAIKGDDVLAGAAIGAATGALAGVAADVAIATGGVGGLAIAALGGAISSGSNYAATELVNDRSVNGANFALEATVGAVANVLTFGLGKGSLTPRAGKLLSNMKSDFMNSVMKGTTKSVAGKTVSRSAPIVKKIVAKNSLMATDETAVIAFGAWYNSNAWGMLLQ